MEKIEANLSELREVLEAGNGIFRLTPTWVPRVFCRPGRRLRLHPDDYYALGAARGGIDERWFSSTTHADNGPGTPDDEGLSYIALDNDASRGTTLKHAVEVLKDELLGDIWNKYGCLPIYSKFFDNLGPLPHHIHQREEHAALTGAHGKPEMYFFPSQMNDHRGEFDCTFFGLAPGVTKDEVKGSLELFVKGDNHLLELSQAYKLETDTGWDVPPGLLHAPGSLCTYEPQFASDVFAMYQSVLHGGHTVDESLLWKNCPEDRLGDFDYLVEVIDWELNTDPELRAHRFMKPIPVKPVDEMADEGYLEEWICYRCPIVSSKRLTVYPGMRVVIKDSAPYGLIAIEGHGVFGGHVIESPAQIRYGEATFDEYFVSDRAARAGVVVENTGREPLVILKHFPENPDLPGYSG